MSQHTEWEPTRTRRTWLWVFGVVVAGLVGIAVGATGLHGPAAADPPAAAVTATVTVVPPTRTITVTAAPVTAPGEPATTFADGTYLVGTDIAAGTYHSDGPDPDGPGLCYWARLRDDAGEDIIANDVSAGPTRFTTTEGEYLEVTGCAFAPA